MRDGERRGETEIGEVRRRKKKLDGERRCETLKGEVRRRKECKTKKGR